MSRAEMRKRESETKFNYHFQREVQHIKLTSSIRLTAERETASVIDSTQFQPIFSRHREAPKLHIIKSLRCNEKMFAYFRHTTERELFFFFNYIKSVSLEEISHLLILALIRLESVVRFFFLIYNFFTAVADGCDDV